MGWLPSAPHGDPTRCKWSKTRRQRRDEPADYVVQGLKDGSIKLSCEDPDNPLNWPRNMFVWRSNILGCFGQRA